MASRRSPFPLILLAALAACSGHGADMPGDRADRSPFHEIASGEAVKFTGTEPFWSGEVTKDRLTFVTPETPEGVTTPVSRFAGRGGLSFSGALGGQPFTLAVTPGMCSDGMSDWNYPFSATMRIGAELRQGCGWTARQPRSGRR